MIKHDFLEPEQLNNIQDNLVNSIADIESRLKAAVVNERDVGDKLPDENDRASLESERRCAQTLRARETVQLITLKKVLNRFKLNTEDFGYCESCGIEIKYQRLINVPASTNCMECQRIEEIKEKVTH